MGKQKEILPFLGYGNQSKLVFMGSVLFKQNLKDSQKNDSFWRNTKRMINLFYTRPVKNETVIIKFCDTSVEVKSDNNGYFEYTLNLEGKITSGFHKISYTLKDNPGYTVFGECMVVDPSAKIGVISDIDDTIVTSYAYGNLKKIWNIISKNSKTRKAKPEVAQFYNTLSANKNPIFYVSSSERNLYRYWMNFFKANGFPIGPLLLRDLKFGLKDFLRSGKGNHNHKYNKIKMLLNFYPFLNFILIGDNGQKDVEIYHKIINDFSGQINQVFIVEVLQKKMDNRFVQDFKKHNIKLTLINDWKDISDLLLE